MAYDLLRDAAPAQKKLQQAQRDGRVKPAAGESPISAALQVGALDSDEAERLQQAEAARRQVIDVDDFAKEELGSR
ncbi:acyl-CoA dehydrogenase [compost metagenome]